MDEGIFNSRGLANWQTQTSSEISITMLASDSSGWQKANYPDVSRAGSSALAEIAARKALESAVHAKSNQGNYTVILEPRCRARYGGIHVLRFRRAVDS